MLTSQHREYLERRAVDPDQFPGRFRSVEGSDTRLANFAPHNKRAGLLIQSGDRYQLRPDSPPHSNGKTAKFVCESGLAPIIDLPDSEVLEGDGPVAIVEGLVKADAVRMCWPDACVIGITGCSTWAEQGTRYGRLQGALERVPWKGRDTYIIFDADAETNGNVKRAEKAFSQRLREQGAAVHVVKVPVLEGDETAGIDDVLASHQPKHRASALAKLIEEAPVMQGRGGPRKRAGRPSEDKRPDSPHELAVVCCGSGNWTTMDGQTAHYERNAGLWTKLSRESVGEVACYPEYTEPINLEPTSGIRKMVPSCILGILNLRGPAPAAPRRLWPFASEVMDVDTGDMMDYERGHYFTEKLDYDPDPNADGRPELFGQFLYSAFQSSEMVHWAERLLTYILFEHNRHQRLIVWQGVPGSGKGVLMGLLGDMMGSQHLATLNERLAWEEATWALMPLAGARVAILPETNRGLPAHTAKAITGHDQIAAAPKGGHQISFVYRGHLIYSTNKQLSMSDPGMERRLLTLPFTGKPAVVDTELPAKLRELRPQIWTHLWELWQEVKDDPLEPPAMAQDASRATTGGDWEEWAEERLEIDLQDGNTETTAMLVWDYLVWKGEDATDEKEKRNAANKMRRKAPGLGLIAAGRGAWRCKLKEEEANGNVQ